MILAHILFCSRDAREMLKRYDLWLPLFAAYLIYPLFVFSFGEPRLYMFLPELDTTIFAKFIIMFLSGAFSLLILRVMLQIHKRYNLIRKLL